MLLFYVSKEGEKYASRSYVLKERDMYEGEHDMHLVLKENATFKSFFNVCLMC